MEKRNLEKALDIMSALLLGEQVSQKGNNAPLYEEYSRNSEVYDILTGMLKRMDISLYEYNNALFISAGTNNRVFGFSNEELKRMMGLRLNKELFLVYFIIYCIITEFYHDSQSSTYVEYVRMEDVIKAVNGAVSTMVDHSKGIVVEEAEADSFKAMALLWDELPDVSVEDKSGNRAARNSHTGFLKLTFNFLVAQGLFTEMEDRFYPTDRFKAIAQNYFEDNRSRLYDMMKTEVGGDNNATD